MPTAPEYVLFALEDCVLALAGKKPKEEAVKQAMEALERQLGKDYRYLKNLRNALDAGAT